jgi:hypothetical protein
LPRVDGHVAAVGVPPVGLHVVHFVEFVELLGFIPCTAGFALPLCCSWPFEAALPCDVVFELACVELEECIWPFELALELACVELEDVASGFACPGATWSEGAAATDASACASTWAAG